MFLTALLTLNVLILAGEKHRNNIPATLGIGLALFVAELAGVYYTGGSVNPTRSLGPSVARLSFPGYHWIIGLAQPWVQLFLPVTTGS